MAFNFNEAGQWGNNSVSNAPTLRTGNTQFNENDYLKNLGLYGQDVEAMDRLRSEALGTSPSRYAQSLKGQQMLGEQNALQSARARGNTASSQAMRGLQSRGGMASGGRERMARAGQQSSMQAESELKRQGMLDRLGIEANDEKMRVDLLKDMSKRGESTAANRSRIAETNIDRLLKQIDQENKYKNDQYKTGLQLYGAEQQAKAQKDLADKQNTGFWGNFF